MNKQGKTPRKIARKPEPTDQHVYHHTDTDRTRLNVKVEKNTKGFNYEVTVTGAKTVKTAKRLVDAAIAQLAATYGNGNGSGEAHP